MSRPLYLEPTGPLAARAILPGDPARAMAVAQAVIDGPLMTNHARGLWGYTGPAQEDGAPLTVQSTGIGGSSAATVMGELADLGMRRAIRLGTCTAGADGPAPGTAVIVERAIARDGPSRALGAADGSGLSLDERLTGLLASRLEGAVRGDVVSLDLHPPSDATRDRDAPLADLATAALAAAALARGVTLAAALLVTHAPGEVAERERLDVRALELGVAASEALCESADA